MKVLITSGGTKVNVDCVRSVTNMSKGTFGSAICKEFLLRGNEIDFLMAEGSKSPFKYECSLKWEKVYEPVKCAHNQWFDSWLNFVYMYGEKYHEHTYKTFEEYYAKIMDLLKNNKYDMVILAAAVSDYGVANYVEGKIRSGNAMSIELTPFPKIIGEVKKLQPDTFLVGFKLLVGSTEEELLTAAKDSLEKNKCGVVIANDLEHIKQNNHTVLIVSKDGMQKLEKYSCESMGSTLSRELVNCIMLKKVVSGVV